MQVRKLTSLKEKAVYLNDDLYDKKRFPLDTKSQVDGIKRSTGQFVESEVDQTVTRPVTQVMKKIS